MRAMNQVIYVSLIRILPEQVDAFLEAITPLVWSTRKDRSCLFFDLYRIRKWENTFALHEIWIAREARNRHFEGRIGMEIHALAADLGADMPEVFEVEEIL